MGEEHRQSPRISVDLSAVVSRDGKTIAGTVLNCSLSGIFLRTPEKLNEGETLDVQIYLPGIGAPIAASSRVIWADWNESSKLPGFGMHFVTLTDEQAGLLRTFLYG
jgi:hypothetical protein